MNAAVYGISRRRLLRLATAGVFAGLSATPVLQACQLAAPSAPVGERAGAAPGSGSSAGSTGGRVVLPVTVPVAGPLPDLAGSPDGLVAPGYVDFPKNLVKSV